MLKLFKFLKPYQFLIAFALMLIFVQSITELYLPTLMSDIVDVGIVGGDTNFILKTGGFMLAIAAIGSLCNILASYLSSKSSASFGLDLRNAVFTHVQDFSLHEFNNIGTASLITRTTNDITQVQMLVMMMQRMMARAPFMCIGGIIMAVSKNATLSLVLAVATPILGITMTLIARKSMPLFSLMQSKLDKLNLVLRENLTGIRVIRAFNQVDYEKKRFNEANLDLTGTSIQVGKIMAASMPIVTLLLNYTMIAVIWFGSLHVNNGLMQVGDLMAFLQYIMQIMFSLIMVSMMFIMIPRASASATRINEVLETEIAIKDPETSRLPDERLGFVEFKDVSFSYPGAEKPVLTDISFTAAPGEVTAVIGGTGSGKSTLIQLIPRFYDVKNGAILIDGVDIREMAQSRLRERIGFIPQKALLFSGTVAENIRYGKDEATIDEIEEATRIAQASDFVSALKDGFDSDIAQRGTNISGGQKQRLSIARALVRRPDIYLFDDSFSALDFKTDAKLRMALNTNITDATVIIVAQRVSTIMNADKIIVLHEGRITGSGKHKDLLDTCDVYREIVLSQLSEEEIA
jgi:ATP-binding cassette subfamily B multidrug efflux pump